MADIHFQADMDLSKLDAAIKQSNTNVGDWVKGIEKAGSGLDTGMKKITDVSEQAVKKQKELVKSIEEEIKLLMAQLNKSFNLTEIKQLDNALEEARGKLRDAERDFQQMQQQQIEGNAEEEVSQGGLIKSLGKWAAGIFTVAAAIKFVKDIIASTEGSTNKLEEAVALLKGGFQGLYRTIATGDWASLIANITETARATRDLKRATSELEHIVAGGTIKRANLVTGLEQARENAAGATNPEEKKNFLAEAIDFQKQITELNVNEKRLLLKIDEDYYFKLTGHSKEYYNYLLQQIPNIAKDYQTYYSQQEGWQLRLNQLRDREKSLGTWQRDADNKAILTKSGLTEAEKKEEHQLKLLLFTLQDYKILQEDLSKKGQWDEYIKGIGAMQNEVGLGERALVRLTTQFTAAGVAAAKMAEIIRAQPIGQLSVPGVSTPLGTKVPSVLAGAPKFQHTKEEEKAINESLKTQLELRNEILNSVTSLVSQIGQQLGLDDQAMTMLNSSLDSFTQLVSGDVPGAAFSLLSGLLAQIPSAASKFEAQINRINSLLEEQQRLIEQSYRIGGTKEALQADIDILEKKRDALAAAIKKERQKFAPNLKILDNWTIQLFAISDQIEDTQQELDDLKVGNITQNTLADAIAQGFEEGKTSIDDFGEYMNQVLLDAVLNIFKSQFLLPKINEMLMPVINEALADNVITADEKARIDAATKTVADMLAGPWKDLTSGLNIGNDISKPQGLTGTIQRTLTEETGNELAGLWRRSADDTRQIRDFTKAGVDHMIMIEANTYNTVMAILESNKKLDSIVSNTKPTYVADL